MLGRQKYHHCGIILDSDEEEMLFHSTIEGTTIDIYSPYWRRQEAASFTMDKWYETKALGAMFALLVTDYHISYGDWIKMLFKKRARNCAHAVAVCIGADICNFNKTLTPDILYEYLNTVCLTN